MQKLYSQCLEEENIEKAIHTVFSHTGAKTAGADGISKTSNITQERIIKEVKLRLRRYRPVQSRKVQIPKGTGEYRELTIINLFDRIAQQAVYQIIAPILEKEMSKHSYGFRKGIGTKIPVSKMADVLLHAKDIYTVELDFKKCFDNIPLEKAIGAMKEMGIKNFQLLRTIKHLMWTSKEYLGVGLSQGTILGPLLANCYLTKLDKFVGETFEINNRDRNYISNYQRHKDDWIQWNMQRGKKICCKYYRYADDTFIICHNIEEQKYITETISRFISQELDIELNEEKSNFRHNEIHYLGFKLIKNKRSIWIFIDKPKQLRAKLKKFKFKTYEQCHEFMKWLRGILNYFDIVNDMSKMIQQIIERMYYRSNKNLVLRKVDNVYQYGKGTNLVIIDVYTLRKMTRVSYKEYIFGNQWLERREALKQKATRSEYDGTYQYVWALWTKQKGKDAVTGEKLNPTDINIHHVKPRAKGGKNEINNLILVSSKTHYLIHNRQIRKPKLRIKITNTAN